MAEDQGLEIVLTPLQLAAVLDGDSIDEGSTLTNRFWGAATTLGGALELVGAAGLFLVPEPTMVTKVGGGVLAVHGTDTLTTGVIQIVTGRSRTTLTSQAATALAEELGAEPGTASTIGSAVDIAVPLIAGFAGALRAVAIRRGAIRLAEEEAAGGHTLLKHVGRTEAQLRTRLAQEFNIPAASTFNSLRDAEMAVSQVVRANKTAIEQWAKVAATNSKMTLTADLGRVVGRGVVRSTNQMQNMTKVIVVLKKVLTQNRVYFVLTSFPKP